MGCCTSVFFFLCSAQPSLYVPLFLLCVFFFSGGCKTVRRRCKGAQTGSPRKLKSASLSGLVWGVARLSSSCRALHIILHSVCTLYILLLLVYLWSSSHFCTYFLSLFLILFSFFFFFSFSHTNAITTRTGTTLWDRWSGCVCLCGGHLS